MANARRRRNRAAMFNAMIAAGHSPAAAGAIANTSNWKKTNKRFEAAMASAPGPAPVTYPTPAAPPAPKPIAPPTQSYSTQAQVGNTVRRPRKGKKKTRLSDLRISRPSINRSLSIGAGGTGLNVGGY